MNNIFGQSRSPVGIDVQLRLLYFFHYLVVVLNKNNIGWITIIASGSPSKVTHYSQTSGASQNKSAM